MSSSTLTMRRESMKRITRSINNTESSMKRRMLPVSKRKSMGLIRANRITGIVDRVNLVKLMLSD